MVYSMSRGLSPKTTHLFLFSHRGIAPAVIEITFRREAIHYNNPLMCDYYK